jgi:predicted ATP-grasp superfamily ATP-dependent carboligase
VAQHIASEVTRVFGLVGLNGIDFIAREGVPYPIEVNPRYSASMELVERCSGASLFELHAQACRGTLPDLPMPRASCVSGKAVLFARRAIELGETRHWLESGAIADIPHPGERIGRGRPICTVFAHGRTSDECLRRLQDAAARLYREVERGARRRGAA